MAIKTTNNTHYFDMTAKTFQGFESVLVEELKNIGARDIIAGKRSVDFKGDQKILYKANLHLRTATRIMIPICKFKAFNENFFIKKIMEIDWSKVMTPKDSYYIDLNLMSKYIKNPRLIVNNTSKSLLDHFRKKNKPQPRLNSDNPELRINIHIFNEFVSIALDSSGDFLFRRGYWAEKPELYINEVLAAGMILLSGWDKKSILTDPMCGSGSIIFEAALIASNIAPNIYTPSFGFMKWKDFDKNLWDDVVDEAKKAEKPTRAKIIGYDSSPSTIKLAKKNLRHANLLSKAEFEVLDFFEYTGKNDRIHMIFEPPSSERIGKYDIYTFYKKMGEHLRTHFQGSTACLLCYDEQVLKAMGLKSNLKRTLLNGRVESTFERFIILKDHKTEDDF